MSNPHTHQRPRIAELIRRLAVPILLFWLIVTVTTNTVVPQVEKVGEAHAVSLSPDDAPAMQAMKRVGKDFHEFDSNNSAMIVLEGDQPLGEAAHRYYDNMIRKLQADTRHVEHVQDFWGDPLTASGAQSADGKGAYVQLYLAGNQGESLANESVQAVRDIVAGIAPPNGLKVYVTGPSALSADQSHAGDKSLQLITMLTIAVIFVMLMLVYRSLSTVLLVLIMVFVELAAARGIVAALGFYDLIGLSTFAVNLLTTLAIAAGTDYAIFLVGRYHEARGTGEEPENAFYTMYDGTAHVILGSGMTIAGATLCLHFTRLPYFQTLGIPLAIGMLVAVAAALTMAPALIVTGSRFGLFEPKRALQTRGWRRIGTTVVRWPGPVLAAATVVTLIGLITLPSYKPAYNDQNYLPKDVPANEGYAAADRHFPAARMNPELLLVETNHDVRNPADVLVIERIAKGIFHTRGIGRVQTITRPLGTPLAHSSIPFAIGMQGTTQQLNADYTNNVNANTLKQGTEMQSTIESLEKMQKITVQMAAATHTMVSKMKDMTADVEALRDHIADFDDFFRPIRNYFYWEPHCYDIPVCSALRSIFDTIDGIDGMTDDIKELVPVMEHLDSLMPQLVAMMPPMIDTMKSMQQITLTMYQSQRSQQDQQQAQSDGNVMGQTFDASKNDDSFYLPPEVFSNADFIRGMKMFISPDGKAVEFIISHEGDPATQEGISRIDAIKDATFDAIKGTPLEGSKVYLGGTASTYKDMQDGSSWDLLIAGISALCLIFIIMLLLTRAVIASAVIVGTVLLSLGTSFGLSVLIWQHLLHMPLHWMILGMSVIILLAVGSDYNLLLVSRFKEEIHTGIKTGIIRSMAGTGAVVTSAGLVFAFTMMSMVVSDLRVIGQVGTTIGLGLLVDTLVIRSFMTPAIAALMGRWFWWPQNIRTRPRPASWPQPQRDSAPVPVSGSGSPNPHSGG